MTNSCIMVINLYKILRNVLLTSDFFLMFHISIWPYRQINILDNEFPSKTYTVHVSENIIILTQNFYYRCFVSPESLFSIIIPSCTWITSSILVTTRFNNDRGRIFRLSSVQFPDNNSIKRVYPPFKAVFKQLPRNWTCKNNR